MPALRPLQHPLHVPPCVPTPTPTGLSPPRLLPPPSPPFLLRLPLPLKDLGSTSSSRTGNDQGRGTHGGRGCKLESPGRPLAQLHHCPDNVPEMALLLPEEPVCVTVPYKQLPSPLQGRGRVQLSSGSAGTRAGHEAALLNTGWVGVCVHNTAYTRAYSMMDHTH